VVKFDTNVYYIDRNPSPQKRWAPQQESVAALSANQTNFSGVLTIINFLKYTLAKSKK
jgi:hypothetical protein